MPRHVFDVNDNYVLDSGWLSAEITMLIDPLARSSPNHPFYGW
jgi:hypothetical protein